MAQWSKPFIAIQRAYVASTHLSECSQPSSTLVPQDRIPSSTSAGIRYSCDRHTRMQHEGKHSDTQKENQPNRKEKKEQFPV